MAAYGQPGRGPRYEGETSSGREGGPSLFERIPWKIVIPAGMQLAQELREAVKDYSAGRGPDPRNPGPVPPPGVELGPRVDELHRRLDRLETHHDELGRLIERLAAQEAERGRALQSLAMRVAVLIGVAGAAVILSLVALIAALAK